MATVMSSCGMASSFQDAPLCEYDFPPAFKDGRHPDDYVLSTTPMQPELIYHHRCGGHNRLWLRLSWQVGQASFLPVSFLLNTAAPKHIYASEALLSCLEGAGLAPVDEELSVQYVAIFCRKALVEPTPTPQAPANIMGLLLLKRFGLVLHEGEPHFSFQSPLWYLTATLPHARPV